MKYRVAYAGFYIIEADTLEEALESDRSDAEYEEYENCDVIPMEASHE